MQSFNISSRCPIILDEHDIEYEIRDRLYQRESVPVKKLYYWMERLKLMREEQRFWERVDACALSSRREQHIFRRRLPGKLSAVVPNGADLQYLVPAIETPTPRRMVFVGSMGYGPNVDAVEYFVHQILPQIVRHHQDAHLTIVGGGAGPAVSRLVGPHVSVTGWVPDVRPYVRSASVVVVPLRIGSGTRLKVLEALAMGKAIVSTPLGSEGIDVRDGEHVLIADDPRAFVQATTRIFADQTLMAALGRNGRRLVEQQYSWDAAGRSLRALYAEVLQSDRRRRHPGTSVRIGKVG